MTAIRYRLAIIEAATTVTVRSGKLSATDGPFAETKEQLGGFRLTEARNLSDAIKVAVKIPLACRGIIEGRPTKSGPGADALLSTTTRP